MITTLYTTYGEEPRVRVSELFMISSQSIVLLPYPPTVKFTSHIQTCFVIYIYGSTFLKDPNTKTTADAESRRKMVSFHVLFLFLVHLSTLYLFSNHISCWSRYTLFEEMLIRPSFARYEFPLIIGWWKSWLGIFKSVDKIAGSQE